MSRIGALTVRHFCHLTPVWGIHIARLLLYVKDAQVGSFRLLVTPLGMVRARTCMCKLHAISPAGSRESPSRLPLPVREVRLRSRRYRERFSVEHRDIDESKSPGINVIGVIPFSCVVFFISVPSRWGGTCRPSPSGSESCPWSIMG